MYRVLDNERWLFLALLVFRLLNVLLIQTEFVPDELWQSIEVAHKWVFGYGQLTWEWQPETAIRSSLHPALIAIPYYLAKLLAIDTRQVIIFIPYLLHAIMAAIADLHLYRLAKLLADVHTAKWTLFHQLCNWFTCFCSPRPLANCLEWFLTSMALSYYPWNLLAWWPFGRMKQSVRPIKPTDSSHFFMILAITCVLIRPTAAIIWVPLCSLHLYLLARVHWHTGAKENGFWWTLGWYLLICKFGLLLSCSLDRLFYGHWTLSQWNFLRFNVLLGGSAMYGTHSWHWYITQGVPVLLTTQVVFFLVGIVVVNLQTNDKHHPRRSTIDYHSMNDSLMIMGRSSTLLIVIIVWTIFCYSLLAHKEFRFLFPVVPIMMYLCGRGTVFILKGITMQTYKFRSRLLILFLISTHLPVTLYTTIIHQRGGLDVITKLSNRLPVAIDHLSKRSSSLSESPISYSVLSLMPCHSLPPISYLHQNITLRQLACDPDLMGWPTKESKTPYVNEAENFYEDPVAWLEREYGRPVSARLPDCILAFDHLFDTYPSVRKLILGEWNYTILDRFFHAHFPTHSRHSSYLNAFCLADTMTGQ